MIFSIKKVFSSYMYIRTVYLFSHIHRNNFYLYKCATHYANKFNKTVS